MAGGSGTRFWPYSRKRRPKQFLHIIGESPMVVETCDRLGTLARDDELILILGEEHVPEAEALFSDRPVHILAEPVGKNTAPCIGLGALCASHLGSNGPVAFLPADHFIGKKAAFLEALETAAALADTTKAIVTLGIIPSGPETGYGYIQKGDAISGKLREEAYRVSSFVEKPDLDTARQYLADGGYFWNAGIFVATPDTVLTACRNYLPELYSGLMRLQPSLGTDRFPQALEEVYSALKPVSFDYGIMEKTEEPVFVIPCECGWSDVGSWASLYALRQDRVDHDHNYSEGEAMLIDCRGSSVSSRAGRLVACLGLRNCLVVDTPDALLVADIERSQEIRKIVDRLKKEGKDDLL
jgi:mannose-1-phosphate guanylyltransferase